MITAPDDAWICGKEVSDKVSDKNYGFGASLITLPAPVQAISEIDFNFFPPNLLNMAPLDLSPVPRSLFYFPLPNQMLPPVCKHSIEWQLTPEFKVTHLF